MYDIGSNSPNFTISSCCLVSQHSNAPSGTPTSHAHLQLVLPFTRLNVGSLSVLQLSLFHISQLFRAVRRGTSPPLHLAMSSTPPPPPIEDDDDPGPPPTPPPSGAPTSEPVDPPLYLPLTLTAHEDSDQDHAPPPPAPPLENRPTPLAGKPAVSPGPSNARGRKATLINNEHLPNLGGLEVVPSPHHEG